MTKDAAQHSRWTFYEAVNIDIRKLVGTWEGYYRIRVSKIRIIFAISKESKEIFVEKVDHRGGVYK